MTFTCKDKKGRGKMLNQDKEESEKTTKVKSLAPTPFIKEKIEKNSYDLLRFLGCFKVVTDPYFSFSLSSMFLKYFKFYKYIISKCLS